MKPCNICKIPKELSEFNKNFKTKDNHSNKCRSCAKIYASKYRSNNVDLIKKYQIQYRKDNEDRLKEHNKLPHVKERQKARAKTTYGRSRMAVYNKRARSKYKNAAIARNKFSNAVTCGKIIRVDQCSKCGSMIRVQAHHSDYSKPFEVIWLCEKDHKEWHKNNTPLNRD